MTSQQVRQSVTSTHLTPARAHVWALAKLGQTGIPSLNVSDKVQTSFTRLQPQQTSCRTKL